MSRLRCTRRATTTGGWRSSRIEDRINNLQREFTRSSDTYAKRFEPILAKWRRIVNEHQDHLTREVESRQEIDSPYIIGVPLADTQELFVGRTDISARIEQLILTRQSLSLLLYGQRRMGKTSLLNNLGHLLPNMTVPLFVDLQGPVTQATDHAGLLYNISRSMITSARKKRDLKLPELSRADLAQDPFSYFDEWLNAVEEVLRAEHRTALLAFDEFEALDDALNKGRFDDQAVLGLLRNLIQHRPRTFKVLLSGSHVSGAEALVDLSGRRAGAEDRLPGRARGPQADRAPGLRLHPRLRAGGQPARARPHAGPPYLLQLLCNEIVMLKNDQPVSVRRLARREDIEAAVPVALRNGSLFFADIHSNQISAASLEAAAAHRQVPGRGRDHRSGHACAEPRRRPRSGPEPAASARADRGCRPWLPLPDRADPALVPGACVLVQETGRRGDRRRR